MWTKLVKERKYRMFDESNINRFSSRGMKKVETCNSVGKSFQILFKDSRRLNKSHELTFQKYVNGSDFIRFLSSLKLLCPWLVREEFQNFYNELFTTSNNTEFSDRISNWHLIRVMLNVVVVFARRSSLVSVTFAFP